MTPTEFLEIINSLSDEDRKSYEADLAMFGVGYCKLVDGKYVRIPLEEFYLSEQ